MTVDTAFDLDLKYVDETSPINLDETSPSSPTNNTARKRVPLTRSPVVIESLSLEKENTNLISPTKSLNDNSEQDKSETYEYYSNNPFKENWT